MQNAKVFACGDEEASRWVYPMKEIWFQKLVQQICFLHALLHKNSFFLQDASNSSDMDSELSVRVVFIPSNSFRVM